MTTKKTVVRSANVSAAKPVVKKPVRGKVAASKSVPQAARVAKAAPEVVIKPAEAKKTRKEHKKKVVRDSFTMPYDEYQKIAEIKETCLKAKMHVKKSEVLRAGLILLASLNDAQLRHTLTSLEKIKTGRPKKH